MATLSWTQLTAQHCDTIKRQALYWYVERNEARELLANCDSALAICEQMDSLNQKALDSYEHAVEVLAEAYKQQEAELKKEKELAQKMKKQRKWFFGGGFGVGAALLLILLL